MPEFSRGIRNASGLLYIKPTLLLPDKEDLAKTVVDLNTTTSAYGTDSTISPYVCEEAKDSFSMPSGNRTMIKNALLKTSANIINRPSSHMLRRRSSRDSKTRNSMQNTSTSSISINKITLAKEKLRVAIRGDKIHRHMRNFYEQEMKREDAKATKYLSKVRSSAAIVAHSDS